ncbi:hypothetical protein O181_037268 [Austropuccinia psidii MF-1]|uniref:Integrase catalytic domain-containing protein n=1 Tax=Austropuccinia psidii MF-1 TaxID=1389203 RepID=A0A9Q3D920_9BASI|nr:hypothetical protein [Austropuccinia psidii MF-1]
MVEYSIELAEKYKLSGNNFLDWKVRMKSILTFKKLYALATGTENAEIASERDKLDPERRDLAFEIICINCNVKIAAQFSAEANNDPMVLWTSIDKYYQPKTIQNQTTYLKRIFSTHLQKHKLEETLNKLHENTRQLCSLIDDKTVKPSILLDSVVAMWTIRNLPEEYKTIGELWLKKCEIEKVTPSLKDTIEELHAYLVRTEEDDTTEKALAAQRNENQNKSKNRCSNNYHNPLAQHSEEDCWKLHPEKRPKFDKPIKALLARKSPPTISSFVLDSGATTSMVNQLEFFQSIEMKEQEIELADGSIIKALGHGTIQLEFQNIILTFSNTLYIPSLATNLISMTMFLRTHHIIKLLNKDEFEVIDKDMRQVVTGSLASGNLTLYYSPKVLSVSTIPDNIYTLHQAAGHPSIEYLRKMFPNRNIPQFDCITCSTCKMTKSPFSGNFPQATRKLEFLHMDLCGPISPPSVSGAQYMFKVLDGYSHFAWTFFLSSKSETKGILKNLIARIERQSNNKVTNIVSDNGTEFVNSELQEFFNQYGISHLTTAPYTPQQNPFAERGNRTTINKARCLLKDSGMDSSLWAEAANTAVYLENLTPSKNINFEVPFKRWFDREPSLKHLQPFGCLTIDLKQKLNGKFDESGNQGLFLGYGETHLSYRIMDPGTGNVKITHHVKFIPTEFPCLKTKSTPTDSESFILVPNPTDTSPIKTPPIVQNKSNENFTSSTQENPSLDQNSSGEKSNSIHKGYSWVPEQESIPQNEIIGDVGHPNNILTYQRRSRHHANLADHLSLDPKTYHEAINGPYSQEWKEAIKSELNNMANHHVWIPTTSNHNIKPLSTTWVFKRKTDEDGNLSKFKARLCVQGFNQKEGIDYSEVFSPTGRLSSLRLLLTLCHINQYPIEQMDIHCAFLNGKPEEILHIHQPLGYTDHPDASVFLLKKSLYGLKQIPRCWHKILKETLIAIGLTPCFTDPCLYYSQNREQPLWLFVHVDDLIFGGTWNATFKTKIKTFFKMEDLGTVKYALGICINQNKEYISLIQDKFIHQILTEFSIDQARPPMAPLPSNYKELKDLKDHENKITSSPPFNFRRVLGLLQYIVQCTCPDLSFAASFLSQFLENPKDAHYKALIHTLKYLSGTQTFMLKLGSNLVSHSKTEILGFTDSDWGGGTERKSFSGSLIYFYGALGWREHKQKVVALSSAEAEYNALTESAQDLAWTKQLIFETTNNEVSCTLHSDNQSAIAIASNPVYHHGVCMQN